MIDLVEAKLLGLWAPREGQKTDAMFMIRDEVERRQVEAGDIHWHWRRLRELGFFTKPKKPPMIYQTKVYIPGIGVVHDDR